MKLIDADRLLEIIENDKDELNTHKTLNAAMIHNGEYIHFIKRILEQPEIHLSVDICYPSGGSIKNIKLN